MYRSPEQATYEIGDEIECFADSNPPAKITWQNLDSLEEWDDSRLVATDRLVGTQRMRCNAVNIIGGLQYTNDYFFNLTVNGIYLLITTLINTTRGQ